MVDLRRRTQLTVAIVVAIAAVVAGLWATNGFGRERSQCPHGMSRATAQPKEGPGRPPICPGAKP
jgi:hypothetical protein